MIENQGNSRAHKNIGTVINRESSAKSRNSIRTKFSGVKSSEVQMVPSRLESRENQNTDASFDRLWDFLRIQDTKFDLRDFKCTRYPADHVPNWLKEPKKRPVSVTKEFDFDKFVACGGLQAKFDKDIDALRRKCQKILNLSESQCICDAIRKSYETNAKPKLLGKMSSAVSSSNKRQSESAPEKTITKIPSSQKKPRIKSESLKTKNKKEQLDLSKWPLRASLFPHVPPYLRFVQYNSPKVKKFPWGQKLLKWKGGRETPPVVRATLHRSGITLDRNEPVKEKPHHWIGTWGLKGSLKQMQKLSRFPGTSCEYNRKDILWYNFKRLMVRFGRREFDFLPESFILPFDLDELRRSWIRWEDKTGNKGETWMVTKIPRIDEGKAVTVINDWDNIPLSTESPLVVQKYIKNPYLINNKKFSLRLYVLVTSFNPLRIYLYSDGLALFATQRYNTNPKYIGNKFIHLTNQGINKLSPAYFHNPDPNSYGGYEWTLKKLFQYMEHEGINTKKIWKKLKDISIKIIVSGERAINQRCKDNIHSFNNCYELFGLDILLDDKMKVWLLESNNYPGLDPNPVENYVHGPMLKSLFDLVQFHLPSGYSDIYYPGSPPCLDPKLHRPRLNEIEHRKHNYFLRGTRASYQNEILEILTGDDVRHLIRAEDEYTVRGQFERIFPTKDTYTYLMYMEPRYYNRLFDAWETKFGNNRKAGIALLRGYCEQKIHLRTVADPLQVNQSVGRS